MKQATLIAVLLPIAIAAIALPAWQVATYQTPVQEEPISEEDLLGPGGPAVQATEVDRLGAMADDACRCTRRSGNEAGCWSGYDKAVSRYKTTRMVSACVPLSATLICFAGGRCIEIDRGGSGDLLCSSTERRAMEAAWNNELAKPDGDTHRAWVRAGAAMDRVYHRILRGQSLAGIKGETGCSG